MSLFQVVRRIGSFRNLPGQRCSPIIDRLEPRSLLSGTSYSFTSDAVGEGSGTHYQLLALKASVTAVKVYSDTSAAGEAVTIAANVVSVRSGGVPTGTVKFLSGTTVIGTAALNASGIAKISTTAIPSGTTIITAVYGGSSKFAGSTSAGRGHMVTLAATSAKLSVTSPSTTTLGLETTLLARVAPVTGTAAATGRVAFYDGATLLASKALNSVGAARLTASSLYVGAHDLKAIYLGSATLLGHRTAVKTVNVTYPSLSSSSDGLQVGVVTTGTGTPAASGDLITLNYTSYLAGSGTKSESTYDNGVPFRFVLGDGNIIEGFNEGLAGVKAGEKRVLIIPPELGYGSTPVPDVPANSTLVFVIDVLAVTPGS